MRKLLLPAALAGTLMLGGCASYGANPLGGLLGGVLGGNDVRTNGQINQSNLNNFEQAAYNACGQQASSYGRVAIDSVRQNSQDTVRVQGRIDSNDRNRDQFTCTFRNDGRITDFRLG